MKKQRERDLEVWGERELIGYILELQDKIEEMEEISIEFTDQDLEELREGVEFNWEYDGVKVNLYKETDLPF
jgi:hypothetical protein